MSTLGDIVNKIVTPQQIHKVTNEVHYYTSSTILHCTLLTTVSYLRCEEQMGGELLEGDDQAAQQHSLEVVQRLPHLSVLGEPALHYSI